MKIVSLDIETTGLDRTKCQVLQLGAIAFDSHSEEFTPISTWCRYIAHDEIHGEVPAIIMNAEHIKRMSEFNKTRKLYERRLAAHRLNSYTDVSDSKQECERIKRNEEEYLATLAADFSDKIVTSTELVDSFSTWLDENGRYKDERGKSHLNIAGKNVYVFDIPFLETAFPNWARKIRPHRRTIDPCALYCAPADLCPPGLEECKKRAILICKHYDKYNKYHKLFTSEVTHDALDDAIDVAKLIWFYFKLSEPVHTLLCGI